MGRWVRLIGWMGLALACLPATAQKEALGQMDQQVTEIVGRARPSVVSIRVGPRRIGRATRSAPPDRSSGEPWLASEAGLMLSGVPDTAGPMLAGDLGDNLFTVRYAEGGSKRAPRAAGVMISRVGTGFVVDRNGTILTTADVVGSTHQVRVQLADGRELEGNVLGLDRPTDVAVVKVDGTDLPALPMATQQHPEPGQWAIIVGNQLGKEHSVWVGTVARTDVVLSPPAPLLYDLPGRQGAKVALERFDLRLPGSLPEGRLLEIDAPVSAGSSGSPVLNSHGEVIGVVVAVSNSRPVVTDPDADPDDEPAAHPAEKSGKGDAEWERKFGKINPEWQRQVEKIAREAQRLGERAGEHARALSDRMAERAKQIAAEATERSKALRERLDQEQRRAAEDKSLSQADRQRLEAERQRQIQREIEPLMRDLRQKLDRDLKPLEEQLRRQLDQDLKPLQEQLKKLNGMLPMVQGMREIRVDLAPQIAREIARAHAEAAAALAAALAGVEKMSVPPAPPAAPAAPSEEPPAPPAAPASPSAEPPAPAAPPAPADPAAEPPAPAAPAAPIPPSPPSLPIPAAVSFWTGHAPWGTVSTYAIPAATAGWVVAQIRDRGRVSRPYLGVRLVALKPDERARLKSPEEARVRVAAVMPDSPAQRAGLQIDDVILEFQGTKVESETGLAEQVAHARVGEPLSLVIWRGGERRTIQVTPRDLPVRVFPQGAFVMPSPMPSFQPFAVPPVQPWRPLLRVQPSSGRSPRFTGIFPSGRVVARASGSGRSALVTLDAQDAELESVLRELSRATGLSFSAEGEAARQHLTLKVDRVSVDDLVQSLDRLYHLRSERKDDHILFRPR